MKAGSSLLKLSVQLTLPLLVAVTLPNCSSNRHDSETTTVTTTDHGIDGNQTVVTEKNTSSKTDTDHDSSGGGLFSIVGDIIALPFRAVGALLSAIF